MLAQFVSVIPDDMVARLPVELQEKCHVSSRVLSTVTRSSAQFYIFELHEMTLQASLAMFPVIVVVSWW